MKRAPIVIGSTAAGLGLVLSFHTHTPKLAKLATGPAGAGPATTPTSSTAPTTTAPAAPAATSPATTPATSPPAPTAPATTAPAATTPATTVPAPTTTAPAVTTRRASSQLVQYRYGDIQLQVTEVGSRITDIAILQEGATDPRSQEINSQAVPMLQQQAMSAQSANIDGVSGATFTSYAYVQALQSALDQLKS